MMSPRKIINILAVLWIVFYTLSYGVWCWKNKNKLGGFAIIALIFIFIAVSLASTIIRS